MMSEGKIVEHGTHEELMQLDGEYASMVKSGIIAEDNFLVYVQHISIYELPKSTSNFCLSLQWKMYSDTERYYQY